jgi:hypothetical protein
MQGLKLILNFGKKSKKFADNVRDTLFHLLNDEDDQVRVFAV